MRYAGIGREGDLHLARRVAIGVNDTRDGGRVVEVKQFFIVVILRKERTRRVPIRAVVDALLAVRANGVIFNKVV